MSNTRKIQKGGYNASEVPNYYSKAFKTLKNKTLKSATYKSKNQKKSKHTHKLKRTSKSKNSKN